MPSAANVKIDKSGISSETALPDANQPNTPIRQAVTIVEHKIRNLEKRKAKLESYRELQNSGKELNQDQKTAVARFDEVVQTLEFARDICKQFVSLAASSEKDAKKQARKETAAKSQAELAKVREVLLVQDALTQRARDTIREDFLIGRNGAPLLTLQDLKSLDDLHEAVTSKHIPGDPTAFSNQIQAAAEHLVAVVDGKPKEIFGSSYTQIKDVIGKIHLSGYLDQAQEIGELPVELSISQETAPLVMTPISIENLSTPQHQPSEIIPPSLESLTIENNARPMEPPTAATPPQIPPPEQMFFQQPLQPPRPISEVLGGSKFFFLQDSELDTPEQIPSQTFTNQNYVAGPPPPIPMPPHFQGYPPQPPVGNNGLEEHNLNQVEENMKQQQQRPERNNAPSSRNNQQTTATAAPPTFYPNNNGYNRPRSNRNGPPRPSATAPVVAPRQNP